MRPIPEKIKKEISKNKYYAKCARQSAECDGRITIEHAMIYAGRQVNEIWALIPLCWYHHLGSGLNKRINEFLALQRATEDELDKYNKSDFRQKREYLRKRFGGKIPT